MITFGSDELRLCLAFVCLFSGAVQSSDALSPAVAECRAEASYLEQIQSYLLQPPAEESFACFQTLEDVDLTHALVVDVRRPEEYENVRIPRSVNLSQLELLHTRSLKDLPVVVVDQGFARTGLAQLCAQAQDKGFKSLKIMTGGLAAWHSAGNPLEGLPQHFEALHTIEPREFLIEAQRNRVSVLAPASDVEPLRSITPPRLSIRILQPETTTDAQLIAHLQQSESAGQYPTVVIGASDWPQGPTSQYRSVFTLKYPLQRLLLEHQDHLAMVKKRQEIPERYRCKG